MARKRIMSKRKYPFGKLEILYLAHSCGLFDSRENELQSYHIETLRQHGLTVEYFLRNRELFLKAAADARAGWIDSWQPPAD